MTTTESGCDYKIKHTGFVIWTLGNLFFDWTLNVCLLDPVLISPSNDFQALKAVAIDGLPYCSVCGAFGLGSTNISKEIHLKPPV